jgi:hypothetical protein
MAEVKSASLRSPFARTFFMPRHALKSFIKHDNDASTFIDGFRLSFAFEIQFHLLLHHLIHLDFMAAPNETKWKLISFG